METLHQQNDIIAQRYRIVAPLGTGAFGTTYTAENLSSDRQPVAIKVLSLRQIGDWKMVELFEREAKILATLNHPAIPKYLEYFYQDTPSDRLFYLVQELVVGNSLAQLVKKGWHGNEEQIKRVALQVLEILNYLHGVQVIHRDIKPQNIIGTSQGKIFLVDFGAVQDIYRNRFMRHGTFVGTVGYMPPEQLKGRAFFASDLYSLGATLLFLLTHRSPADLPQNRMKYDFRSRVQISEEFADWLEKMLEPAVEDRFKSASEAMRVLRGETKSTPTRNTQPQNAPLTRRKPKGSRVHLSKTSQGLRIQLPPSLQTESYILSLCGVISLVGVSFYLFGEYGFGSIFSFLLFCVLVTLVSLFGMSPHYLQIDPQTFRLGWKVFNVKNSDRVRGRTEDIERVDVAITSLLLLTGKDKHEFAAFLTSVERDWLVVEISDFLERLRAN